jgi:hypothetical protein
MVSLMALQAMAPCLVARKVNFANAGYHKREGFVASDAFCREVIRVPICNRLALRSPDFQFFLKTGKQHTYPIHEAMDEEFVQDLDSGGIFISFEELEQVLYAGQHHNPF